MTFTAVTSWIFLLMMVGFILSEQVFGGGQISISCHGDPLRNSCPSNCSCCLDAKRLQIVCQGTSRPESMVLERAVNDIIANHTDITTFEIHNSSLTNISHLDLPVLTNLQNISFTHNDLNFLHEDSFRNLTTLSSIDLTNNSIHGVDPETFLGLPALSWIRLTNNSLTSLDVWPLYLLVNAGHKMYIYVDKNRIEKFTNHLNWTYNCSMPPAYGEIRLNNNLIQHLLYFFTGFGFQVDRLSSALCLWLKTSFKLRFAHNPLVCDCVDFPVYRLIYPFKHSGSLEALKCAAPPDLAGKHIMRVKLINYVCKVTQDCPEGCRCLQRPANLTLHVLCDEAAMTDIPPKLPHYSNMSGYWYNLAFSRNQISNLTDHWFFNLTHLVDLSFNSIDNVELASFRSFGQPYGHSRSVYLDHNNLTTIPVGIETLNLTGITEISLHDNPWSCDCNNKWFQKWLLSVRGQLSAESGILCDTPSWLHGQNILKLDREAFCTNPYHQKAVLIVVVTVAAVVASILFFGLPIAVVYVKRVWIYTHFKWHPFDHDECTGEGKEYDAFVSYATEQEGWVLDLIRNLEDQDFCMCFHRRDFNGGRTVMDNIDDAISKSKRTLVVLSQDFLDSNWCMWEFNTMLHTVLEEKTSRLIVLKYEDIQPDRIPATMQQYMKQYTHVDRHSPEFMVNLIYSLPQNRLGRRTPDSAPDHQPEDRQPLLSDAQ